VDKGYQTAAGFTTRPFSATVDRVEPGSPAYVDDLRPGDEIVALNGHKVKSSQDLETQLGSGWKRGETEVTLKVNRRGKEVGLEPFAPRTLGLHPTQLYETISMVLLFALLLAFEPFKRRDGWVMVLFMVGYAAHRFLNEVLRKDTDPVAFGMTLSQN